MAAAAEGMATLTITDLPLVPLVRIARGLKCADIIQLCSTHPALEAHRDTLLQHARPSLLSRWPIITGRPPPDISHTFLSHDGAHVVHITKYWRGAECPGAPKNNCIHSGPVGGELLETALPNWGRISGMGFMSGPDGRFVVWTHSGAVHIMTAGDGGHTETTRIDARQVCLPIHFYAQLCFTCNSDNNLVFTRGDQSRVFDAVPGAVCPRLGHITVSRDWRLCATTASDYRLYVWDMHTGALLRAIHGPWDVQGGNKTINFSDDGTRLVFCTHGGSVCVWDLVSETQCAFIVGDVDHVIHIVVHGSTALVARSRGWHARAHTDILVVDLVFGEYCVVGSHAGKRAQAIALSPNCTRAMIVCYDDCVHTWHLGDLAVRLRRRGQRKAAEAAAE